MENLWGCFFDVELKTLRDFRDFTRKISTSAAFSVLFLFLCAFLEIHFYLSTYWTFLKRFAWKSSVKAEKLKAGHFVEQVCHPLQWLGVKYSLSCGFLQFPIFDIFVDLGLSRCTLPALLRSPASQFEAKHLQIISTFFWSQKSRFHSVSISVEIQQRFYNHCSRHLLGGAMRAERAEYIFKVFWN